MRVVGHNNIQWDCGIRIMVLNVFNLRAQTFPHRRQLRLAIVHLAEIMFTPARANGDKIFRTIVFVPIGAGRMSDGEWNWDYRLLILPRNCKFSDT